MADRDLLAELAAAPEFTSGSGCTDAEIAVLEKLAGGPLQPTYREFLRRFSFAIWDSGTLYGTYKLGSVLPSSYDLDAARQTKEARKDGIPSCFTAAAKLGLVISKYEGGGFYFLHAGPGKSGTVDLYEFAEDDAPVETWKSFDRFLEKLLGDLPKSR